MESIIAFIQEEFDVENRTLKNREEAEALLADAVLIRMTGQAIAEKWKIGGALVAQLRGLIQKSGLWDSLDIGEDFYGRNE
jgi:hypothetical protein